MYVLMQYIGKLYAVIMASGAVTLGLFYLMQWLVQPDQRPPERPDPLRVEAGLPERSDVPRPEPAPALPDPPSSPVRLPAQPRPPSNTAPLQLTQGMDLPPVAVNPADFQTSGPRLPGPAALDPLALVKSAPHYPPRARYRGIEGYVLVEFDVNNQGVVVNPRVLQSLPQGEFDAAALQALEQWRYRPRIMNGQPVKVFGVRQRLDFSIGS